MGDASTAVNPWLVIRHVEHEDIGTLRNAFARTGTEYRYADVFRGDPVPENPARLAGLVVMGGPMGVYEADRYPFLAAEMSLIRKAAHASVPVLGICLGSQLIAAALGARVYPGPQKEIGWYPVEVVASQDDFASGLAPSFLAFHWHGDTFDLPVGAVRLFRSELYENQGFRWGRNVCALQFHLEFSGSMLENWLADAGCRAEIAAVPSLDLQTIRRQTQQYAVGLEHIGESWFSRFLAYSRSMPIGRPLSSVQP